MTTEDRTPRTPAPNPGQGANGSAWPLNAGQLTRDDLKWMTSTEINAAMADGRLNELLKRK